MAYDPGPLPSVKSIVSSLRWLDKIGDPETLAMSARGIMKDSKSASEAMEKLDKLLRTHGVEEVAQDFQNGVAVGENFKYLNTGDTYTWTIIRHRGRFKLGSWGDLVESLERRGKKFR